MNNHNFFLRKMQVNCALCRLFVLLLLFVGGGVGLITRTESDRRPFTGKIPRLNKFSSIFFRKQEFVPKKSTKLNKEEIEKLSYGIDETKTFF